MNNANFEHKKKDKFNIKTSKIDFVKIILK